MPVEHHPGKIPRATYRLQFHGGFTLKQAIELIPYWAALGISHLYSSPLLAARPGSTHGYDQCDPTRLHSEIGTEEDLTGLVKQLQRHKMGLVIDVVPNHMGIGGPENAWWWDVLTYGPSSRFAHYFDIDWHSSEPRLLGKVLVPVLGVPYEQALKSGELKLVWERDSPVLRYFDQRFPLSPGSCPQESGWTETLLDEINPSSDRLDAILEKQHYRLVWWKEGDAELNYRRFFNITSLAGVRVEDPEVFRDTHQKILEWHRQNWLDGLRIDHPDGLRDPLQYLQRLREAAPGAWIVVEKILVGRERLPSEWPVDGTTGYDFINRVGNLFINSSAEEPLTQFYAEFTGEPTQYDILVRDAKRLVLKHSFGAEISRLTRLLLSLAAQGTVACDFNFVQIQDTITELAACFPVYRTYAQGGSSELSPSDANAVTEAIRLARQNRPDLSALLFDFMEDLLKRRISNPTADDFILRFQQLTGAVMAKGVEDTAFYRFNRFVALNEVGGNPAQFGQSPEVFHEECRHLQAHWPHTMLASTTHDTKRGEDVRARLSLLSEIPRLWIEAVRRWSAINQQYRQNGWPDRNAEYLFYQILVGAWPLSIDRATAYMEKATREAKQHTQWTEPNSGYENAWRHFIQAVLSDRMFLNELERFVKPLINLGSVNSLAQTLIKLTAPGVPDLYQGAEFLELSLVDPDNRRPVDFALRTGILLELQQQFGAPLQTLRGLWNFSKLHDRSKLYLIWRTLQFRRVHPELFIQGQYLPLTAVGEKAKHIVSFARIHESQRSIVIVPRLVAGLAGNLETPPLGTPVWHDTRIELPDIIPPGEWENLLTQERITPLQDNNPPFLLVTNVMLHFPVALLVHVGRG